ncbi:HAMP domain-containing histidine kinase [Microbispora sp. NEAU-D428]|uniref:sensor histidine kinase n=1 Tax=Microbispora sitophila TaxID=2771537 RepID=UPI0018685B5A|nr:HAMP domain-containing sensor histidine kinase [Microbispora sitophila]MBE3009707.1 HAMP domain-containing histidine kinase [Microbispora sitophila]
MTGRPLRRRLLRLAPTTLRARLVVGTLVLLVLACAAAGAASSLLLERFMVERLDQQLSVTAGRFAASLVHEEHEHGYPRNPYGERGDSRGQATGTLGAFVRDGEVGAAVVGRADPVLSAADQKALSAVPPDGLGHTVELSSGGLGDYRVMGLRDPDGDLLVTGLPLDDVRTTVQRLQIAEIGVFAVVVLVTGIAGAVWVRLSLRPLDRVAATARRVARLPLADGEVALPEGVPDEDPRTEIGQVGEAFNRMLGHVGRALVHRHASEQRMRTFAADASHELRTPLATVRAHVQLARRDEEAVPGAVRHALERIDAESARMGTLVDDLLLLTRLDAGRPLAREEVDLTRLAIDATGDARAYGPDHRWRLDLPEEPVTVPGDPDRLHQVVANLLGNARAHTPPGTTVTVALRVPGPDKAELTVTDDGPGIPEDLQGEIFERFVRADRARTRASGGSGLGLAIVKAVVAAHGGTVDVESRPGRTAFRVVLPAGPVAWDKALLD